MFERNADNYSQMCIRDSILPEVQNAPADTLKKALREAARTLCRRSKVWRADVEGCLLYTSRCV